MRQYLLPRSYSGEETLSLSAKERHYLLSVLRLHPGDRFNGIDGDGNVYDLTLLNEDTLLCSPARGGRAEVVSDTLPQSHGGPMIHLYVCLCKGRKDETILREVTEAGVADVTFVQSRFCIADLSGKSAKALEGRRERLEAVIREAVQQSGSPHPTRLNPTVLPLSEVPAASRGLRLLFHQDPQENQKSLKRILGENPCGEISILTGPEGGFDAAEVEMLKNNKFIPVILPTNILRAETAPLYAVAAVQVLLSE